MKGRLWLKFLIPMLIVGGVALSGTFVLRYLMIGDFGAYLEGETEDRVYGILADFEAAYERQSGWNTENQVRDVLWALTVGFEIRLVDDGGKVVIDTAEMLRRASPLVIARLKSLPQISAAEGGQFIPYPLFLGGRQIGTLEIRQLRPTRETIFVRRTDNFLLWSIAVVGGLAILLSLFFSQRLTGPIKDLAAAASEISQGNLKEQVRTTRRDEVGDLARAFNRMAKSLEVQESLRRKLIADVAHELRTPLGVMRGELEGIMDGLIPNDSANLESLYDETGRLKKIVDGIEDLNRAEASRLSLAMQPVNLNPFLTTIVSRLGSLFQEKNVSVDVRCPEHASVHADPERLSQVTLNLLSNALKATGDGGRVSVFVQRGKDGCSIVVEDDGRGISKEDLPHIFERFYHGPGGGLGIGLTIVKELVEAHGGRVEVRSELGKGTTFTIFLHTQSLHNSS